MHISAQYFYYVYPLQKVELNGLYFIYNISGNKVITFNIQNCISSCILKYSIDLEILNCFVNILIHL